MITRPNSLTLLRWIIALAALCITAGHIWRWADPASFSLFSEEDIIMTYGGFDRLLPWQTVLGFMVTAAPHAILLYALYLVWTLTGLLAEGKWFDEPSERTCAGIGRSMILFVVVNWAHPTLLILILTATKPMGEHILSISFSSAELLGLIPALMALIFSRMIALARAQRDELNQIV